MFCTLLENAGRQSRCKVKSAGTRSIRTPIREPLLCHPAPQKGIDGTLIALNASVLKRKMTGLTGRPQWHAGALASAQTCS